MLDVDEASRWNGLAVVAVVFDDLRPDFTTYSSVILIEESQTGTLQVFLFPMRTLGRFSLYNLIQFEHNCKEYNVLMRTVADELFWVLGQKGSSLLWRQ